MNGFVHHLPTPSRNYPSPTESSYTGETSDTFSVLLMLSDLLDDKGFTDYMSSHTFASLPVYAAFMGAGWADVYAHR